MSQNLGRGYHPVWEDGDIEKIVRRAQAVAKPGLAVWTVAHYGLIVGALIILAAVVYLDNGRLAIISLVCFATAFFSKSGENMAAYDYAVQTIWEARIAAQQGKTEEAFGLVREAIRIIRPNVVIVSPAHITN